MGEKLKGVGSLPVPNVQALADDLNGSADIPHRYIRPEAGDPVVSDGDLEIPIIDMMKLLDPHSFAQESGKLHLACQDWGFFQLINHNIPSEVVERMKVDVTEFFRLPLEEKKAFSQLPGNLEGYGQLFVVSEEQKLDWADLLYLSTQPVRERSMIFWPTQPPTFRDTIDIGSQVYLFMLRFAVNSIILIDARGTLDSYSSELYSLARTLLGFMAKNLGVNPEVITSMLKDGIQSVRINYYPPCPQADKTLGFSPHSDGSLVTLVLQVNQVQGLQIKKNGAWVPVKPLPGAFIVNIGDNLEIFSNGIYKSIEHRATANKEKVRLSVAAFHSPSSDSVVGPLPDIVRDAEAKYKTVNNEEYRRLFFSAKLDGKSFLDRMKLNR